MAAFLTTTATKVLPYIDLADGKFKSLKEYSVSATPGGTGAVRGQVDQLKVSELHVGDGSAVKIADTAGTAVATFNSAGNHNIGKADQITTFAGSLTVTQDLVVSGSTTTINTTNMTVADSLIELSSGLATAEVNDAGLVVERGTTGDNAAFVWDKSATGWRAATTTATGASTGDLTLTDAKIYSGALDTSGSVAMSGAAATFSVTSTGNHTFSGGNLSIDESLDFGTGASAITAAGNPSWNFGTNQATFGGNVDANNGLDVAGGNLTVAAGLSISGVGALTYTQSNQSASGTAGFAYTHSGSVGGAGAAGVTPTTAGAGAAFTSTAGTGGVGQSSATAAQGANSGAGGVWTQSAGAGGAAPATSTGDSGDAGAGGAGTWTAGTGGAGAGSSTVSMLAGLAGVGGAGTWAAGTGGAGAAGTVAAAAGAAGGVSTFRGGLGGVGTANSAPGAGGNGVFAGGDAGAQGGGSGNANGGAAYLRGGNATGSGTDGVAYIGDLNTSAIEIGLSGITTDVLGNLDANLGLDVTGAAFTFTGTLGSWTMALADSALTQTGTGTVTFTGNVDATLGLDVTGALTVSTTANIDGALTVGATDDMVINVGSITSVSGAISFGNENLTTTGTLASGNLTVTGSISATTTANIDGALTVGTADDMVINVGSITSVSGAISFGNENLTTTGTLASGNHTITGTLSASTTSSLVGAVTVGDVIKGTDDGTGVIVGHAGASASTGSALQVVSLTTTQRGNLVAANGMLIYNTTTTQFEGYDGSWGAIGAGGAVPGTDNLTYSVNQDAASTTAEDPALILMGGDNGAPASLWRHYMKMHSSNGSAATSLYQTDDGAEVGSLMSIGQKGQIANLTQTLQFAGGTGAAASVGAIAYSNAGGFTADKNFNATAGLDVSGADLTFTGTLGSWTFGTTASALTQTGTGTVTFTGNVDATNGLDVTTAALTAAAGLTVSAGTVNIDSLVDVDVVGGSLSPNASFAAVSFDATATESTTGTHARITTVEVGAPVITDALATTTVAASLYVAAAPSGGATNYALWVDAGNTKLDGALAVDGSTTLAGIVLINGNAVVDIDSGAGTWDATTLSLDATDTTNLTMTANAVGAKTLTIAAINSGAGTALLDIDADDAITIDSTAAGVSIDGAAASNFSTSSGDLTLSATVSSVVISGAEAIADAVALTATSISGGIDINAGTTSGIITLDAGGGISIDAGGASNFTAGGTLTLASSSISGNIDIDAGTTSGNVTIDAGTGGISLDSSGASNFTTTSGTLTLASTAATTGNVDIDAGATSGTVTVDAGGGISIDAGAASNFSTSAGNLTLAATSISASVDIDAGATSGGVTIDAGSGGVSLDASGASNFTTSSGVLTLTSADAATWSVTSGNLTLNAGGANSLALQTGGAARFTVSSTAAVSTVNITPSSGTLDIGSAADDWQNFYLSKGVIVRLVAVNDVTNAPAAGDMAAVASDGELETADATADNSLSRAAVYGGAAGVVYQPGAVVSVNKRPLDSLETVFETLALGDIVRLTSSDYAYTDQTTATAAVKRGTVSKATTDAAGDVIYEVGMVLAASASTVATVSIHFMPRWVALN